MGVNLQIRHLAYPPPPEDEAALNPHPDNWQPKRVLTRPAAANDPSETLIRLLIACAIIEGPNRMEELVLQIERLCAGHVSHLQAKLNDPLYQPVHAIMKEILAELNPPRAALASARARLANTINSSKISLILYDLVTMIHFGRLSIFAYLIGTSRSRLGAEQLIACFSKPPTMLDAKDWKNRFFPGADFETALLFEPVDYGRIVVVLRDGHLAYDPAPGVSA